MESIWSHWDTALRRNGLELSAFQAPSEHFSRWTAVSHFALFWNVLKPTCMTITRNVWFSTALWLSLYRLGLDDSNVPPFQLAVCVVSKLCLELRRWIFDILIRFLESTYSVPETFDNQDKKGSVYLSPRSNKMVCRSLLNNAAPLHKFIMKSIENTKNVCKATGTACWVRISAILVDKSPSVLFRKAWLLQITPRFKVVPISDWTPAYCIFLQEVRMHSEQS